MRLPAAFYYPLFANCRLAINAHLLDNMVGQHAGRVCLDAYMSLQAGGVVANGYG